MLTSKAQNRFNPKLLLLNYEFITTQFQELRLCGKTLSNTAMKRILTALFVYTTWLSCLSAFQSTGMDHLLNSSKCAAQMATMSEEDVSILDHLVPPSSFADRVHKHMQHRHLPTLLLLEVDLASHLLALNHIECLRISKASIVPFVVAYEAGVCEIMSIFVSGGCFFDREWSEKLVAFYKSSPGADSHFDHNYRVMLGRMMTTVVALCSGYNVFLSDSDIVYYWDPIDYVFHNADIMITATFIHNNGNHWGDFYFTDQPNSYATLNNGVVFFKSTEVVRNLHITMATEGIRGMLATGDRSQGFLQVIFNEHMVAHNMSISPCRYEMRFAHVVNLFLHTSVFFQQGFTFYFCCIVFFCLNTFFILLYFFYVFLFFCSHHSTASSLILLPRN